MFSYFRVPINRLAAGDYVLYVYAEDVTSLAQSRAVVSFAVR